MWPFNRNKKPADTKAPKEVQQYYASEHRERVGLAWLIAFGTLIITMIVVIGFFFGGRWAYRKIAHSNNNPPVATKPQPVTQPAKPTTTPAAPKPAPPKPTSTTSTQETNTSPQTSSTSTQTPSQSAASTPTQTSASNQTPSKNMTNTGPGETVAIFVVVSLAGAMAHQTYLRRKIAA